MQVDLLQAIPGLTVRGAFGSKHWADVPSDIVQIWALGHRKEQQSSSVQVVHVAVEPDDVPVPIAGNGIQVPAINKKNLMKFLIIRCV